jgi:hypothetical protein
MSLEYTDGEWVVYAWTQDDLSWRKQGGKMGNRYIRTEKEMCERHTGNVFTRGQNSDYPGCNKGWCCTPNPYNHNLKSVEQIKLKEKNTIQKKKNNKKEKKYYRI